FIKLGLQKGEFDKGIDDAKRQTSAFGSAMGKIGGMIAGVFAVGQITSFIRESMKLAAETENVRKAFIRLGGGAYFNDLNNAVRGTLSQVDLMKNTIQATNFGIPIKDLANLFKFATERAAQTGQSVEYLTQSIVMGIGRKSVLILDNLGISAVQLREKLKKVGEEAATVGDVAEAIGEIAQEQFKRMGEQATTTAQKIDSVSGSWKNIKIAIGDAINKNIIFISGLKIISDYLGVFSAQAANAMINAGNRVKKFMEGIPKDIASQKTAIKAELEKINEEIAMRQTGLETIPALQPSIFPNKKRDEAIQEINTLKNQAIELVGVFDQLKMKSEPVELMQRISDLELLISIEKKLASQKGISAEDAITHANAIAKAEEELKKLREIAGIKEQKFSKGSIGYLEEEIKLLGEKIEKTTNPQILGALQKELSIKEDILKQEKEGLKFSELRKISNKDISEMLTKNMGDKKPIDQSKLVISAKMKNSMIDSDVAADVYNDQTKKAKAFTDELNQIISSGIMSAIESMATGLTELALGDIGGKEFGLEVLQMVGNFMITLGTAIVTYSELFKRFIENISNPWVTAGLGIGLIAAGAAISSIASHGLKGSSGSASNSSAASGYSNYSASSGAAVLSGNVVFELEGTKLRGALNNTDRRNTLIR
ncbi:MAG: hypothetical protein ABFD61_05750, partial [Chloroherpetonaceae bacterium]